MGCVKIKQNLSYITEFIFLIVKKVLHCINYFYCYCLFCRYQSFLIKFYCLICCWMTTVLCPCRVCRNFGFLRLLTSLFHITGCLSICWLECV